MRLLTLDPINGDQRQFVKAKTTKLEPGERHVWFTSGTAATLISNGFHADKLNLV